MIELFVEDDLLFKSIIKIIKKNEFLKNIN